MDFDINWILVPALLVCLLVWLADKLFLKQHHPVAHARRALKVQEKRLTQSKKILDDALKHSGIASNFSAYVYSSSHPEVVKDAYNAYQKHKQAHATLGHQAAASSEHFLVDWAYEFLPILLFLIVVRSFIFEPFNIPSSSMVPSLYTGDYILVNKWAYGLRLPLLYSKIVPIGSPQHGDVVVFHYPKNEKVYYIKRVIGVPGDVVRFDNGFLTINGTPIATEPAKYAMSSALLGNLYPQIIDGQTLSDDERLQLAQKEEQYARYRREYLGAHSYLVRYLEDLNSSRFAPFLQEHSPELSQSNGASWQITVPEGKYFVMGDNRDRSADARFWGFVDDRHLAGKASYIWMHKKSGLNWPSFERFGRVD